MENNSNFSIWRAKGSIDINDEEYLNENFSIVMGFKKKALLTIYTYINLRYSYLIKYLELYDNFNDSNGYYLALPVEYSLLAGKNIQDIVNFIEKLNNNHNDSRRFKKVLAILPDVGFFDSEQKYNIKTIIAPFMDDELSDKFIEFTKPLNGYMSLNNYNDIFNSLEQYYKDIINMLIEEDDIRIVISSQSLVDIPNKPNIKIKHVSGDDMLKLTPEELKEYLSNIVEEDNDISLESLLGTDNNSSKLN